MTLHINASNIGTVACEAPNPNLSHTVKPLISDSCALSIAYISQKLVKRKHDRSGGK